MPTTAQDQPDPHSLGSAERADLEALGEQSRLFMVLLLGLLIVTQLPLPFRLAGIALALAAGWSGIRVLIRVARLRKVGIRPRGSVLVSVGLGLTAVLLVTLSAEAAYYPLAASMQRCRSGANTQTAVAACDRSARSQLDDVMNRLSRPR